MNDRDDADPRDAMAKPTARPEQWQGQASLDGPNFGQQVYGPDGGYSEDGSPAVSPGPQAKVGADEALGNYEQSWSNDGGPVWGHTGAPERPGSGDVARAAERRE